MAKMTITQASDVNVVLDFLLGGERAPRFADERVEEACARLAADASKALMAGWWPEKVREAFASVTINVRRHRSAVRA